MRIFFIIPYPLQEAPSQRFRFEQYFALLEKSGHHFQTQSFLSSKDWKLFFRSGQPVKKLAVLIKGYLKRVYGLWVATKFDFIFIHREAAPLGPPVFEWILARVLRKKIIYDFDDAIWLTDRKNESSLLSVLKWRGKVSSICRWSYKVSCGNRYLEEYALQVNPNSFLNPTTLDCEKIQKEVSANTANNLQKVVIGWTGSHSTLKYLELLEPVLQKLENEFEQVSFLVIADQPPSLNLKRQKFLPWNAQTEIDDLCNIDIGIMPLPDDEWTKGKCGFKALQYMALKIPAVVSSVGVNPEIIAQEVEGYLCSNEEEWLTSLRILITNPKLRFLQGKNGSKKVVEHYSVTSNSTNFLSFFL